MLQVDLIQNKIDTANAQMTIIENTYQLSKARIQDQIGKLTTQKANTDPTAEANFQTSPIGPLAGR